MYPNCTCGQGCLFSQLTSHDFDALTEICLVLYIRVVLRAYGLLKDTTKGNGASHRLGERIISSCTTYRTSWVIKGLTLNNSDIAAHWLVLSVQEESVRE